MKLNPHKQHWLFDTFLALFVLLTKCDVWFSHLMQNSSVQQDVIGLILFRIKPQIWLGCSYWHWKTYKQYSTWTCLFKLDKMEMWRKIISMHIPRQKITKSTFNSIFYKRITF